MANRSQQESEQPAKVYQLDAVDAKVDTINTKLDTLLRQTSGLVTTSQLSEAERDVKEYVNDALEKVHLEYRPFKRNASWLTKLVIGQIVTVTIAALFTAWIVLK
jgi:hypothetical protein